MLDCGHFRIETLALNRRVLDTFADVLCGAGFSIQKMSFPHVCLIELIIEYN